MLVGLLSKRPPVWAAFVLAVVLVLATLGLRFWLGVAFGQRPLLILFVFPIIISAHFGGLWPGLFATFLAAGCISYALIPPLDSFDISATHDLVQWLMLVISGVLVSILNEALSRSQRREESSQQLQAATLSSLGEAVVTTDGAGHITYLNSQAERLTGWPKSEALGLPLSEVVVMLGEHDRKPLVNVIQAALGSQDGDKLPSAALLQKRDSEEITIALSSEPILDDSGATKGIVLALSDITDRKLVEEALRETIEQTSIKNRILEIFASVDDDLVYESILEMVREILGSEFGTFGYFRKDGSFATPAMTRRVFWDKCNVPDKEIIFEAGRFSGIWRLALETGKTIIVNHGPFQTPPGHIEIVNTVVSPIYYRGKLLSAIHLANKPGGYDERDRALLEMIAENVAPVLHARLRRQEEEENRQRVEEALRVSEEQYRQLVQHAPAGIYEIDLSARRFLSVNEVMCEYTGYSQAEFLALDPMELLTEQSRMLMAERLGKIAAGREVPSTVELRIKKKNAELIWALLNVRMQHLESGRVVASVVAHDITERKRAESAVHESQATMEAAMEAMTDAVFISDASGRFILINEAFANFHRFQNKAECLKTLVEYPEILDVYFSNGELAPLDQWAVSRALRGETVNHAEYGLYRKDTGERWMGSYNFAPIRDQEGKIIGSVVVAHDITERKRTEEELHRVHESLQMALTTSSAGAWDWDVITGRVEWSSQLFDLFGLDPFKDSSSFESWRSVLHPEDAALAESRIERAIEQHSDLNSDYRIILPSGKVRWINAVGRAEYDDHGRPIRMAGICLDTTARKQAQEDTERLEASLRHAQKLQAVGTLASGVAHEFNNLLGTIMGYTEMVQEQVRGRDDILADLSQIMTASERGRDLVRNILSFARKAEPQARPLNLNTEVRNSKELLGQLLPRAVSIETRLAPDLKHVSMAASHLTQILVNLATNANHAMPDGGKLAIKTENISIDRMLCFVCGEKFSGEYVLLSVTDTGHGMNDETVQRIFEPFFSTKEVGSGTGLGLSVVQGLVKSYGGHIMSQSEVGKGTTFKIFLPVFQLEEKTSVTEGPAQPTLVGGTETILLVDDEESLRNVTQRYLSDVGYAVHQAGNGEDALEIYRQNPRKIDLVILDLGMAGMGGHTCLMEILAINPKAKVVVASGYTADGQDQKALSDGAAAFVGKPFKKAELLVTVRSILDKS